MGTENWEGGMNAWSRGIAQRVRRWELETLEGWEA
jgi:hypothetical protein